jgi:hypothetical protein
MAARRRALLCCAAALAAVQAEASSPVCAAALRQAFGGVPPVAPVKHTQQEACLEKLFQSEMQVREAGCNTGDQSGFCRGQTDADRGANIPPAANVKNNGISGGLPRDIDCPVRELAYEFAVKLQGSFRGAAGLKPVHDALQLEADCGMPFDPAAVPTVAAEGGASAAEDRARWIQSAHKTVLHVAPARSPASAAHGDGSLASPIGSVAEAVRRAGLLRPSARPVALVLGGGVHVLDATLELGPEHSNLTFISAPGDTKAVVTGAVPLQLEWKPFDVDKASGHNIYVAQVGSQVDDIPGLRVGGGRAIRARYPNSVTEDVQDTCDQGKTSKQGCPYIMAFQETQNWTKPIAYPPARTVAINEPNRYDVAPEFGTYSVGTGGACSVYTPPESYWCSNHTSGGGAFTFRTPSGLEYTEGIFPNEHKWTDPVADGAIINIWRPSRWSNWMFKWRDWDKEARRVMFGSGGFQGARGSDNGGDFFIENVREELDFPTEFFFDKAKGELFYFHNATVGTPIPASLKFEATKLKTIIHAQGNASHPVTGLSHVGVHFTGSRIQFMDPHGVPSGGDWALQRDAALFFEGTEGTVMRDCTVERVDGNAVMLSGYNRRATIERNSFSYIGDSVIASWGHTKEVDGVEGNDG